MEPVAKVLQTKVINMDEVHCHVKKLLSILKSDRSEKNSEFVFKEILSSAKNISADFYEDFLLPRTISKTIPTSGSSTKSAEDCFRVSLFIPYLD